MSVKSVISHFLLRAYALLYPRQAWDTVMDSWAPEIKLRAIRKMGRLLIEMGVSGERGPGGRRRKWLQSATIKTLNEIGIKKNESARAQMLAVVAEEEVNASRGGLAV